jgi:hypothetical protein
MSPRILAFVALAVLVVACDDKKEGAAVSAPASASAAAAAASAAAATSSAPAATSSAPAEPAASSTASMVTGDAKDVALTVRDPKKEPEKTIKAALGGSVTVFLPDYPGTVWSVDQPDKGLGKPKEEVIPGFAPGTNGHQFKWTTTGPLLKAGEKHTVRFGNKKAGDKAAKPTETFALTIELT